MTMENLIVCSALLNMINKIGGIDGNNKGLR